jgi:hypothetical protein
MFRMNVDLRPTFSIKVQEFLTAIAVKICNVIPITFFIISDIAWRHLNWQRCHGITQSGQPSRASLEQSINFGLKAMPQPRKFLGCFGRGGFEESTHFIMDMHSMQAVIF